METKKKGHHVIGCTHAKQPRLDKNASAVRAKPRGLAKATQPAFLGIRQCWRIARGHTRNRRRKNRGRGRVLSCRTAR